MTRSISYFETLFRSHFKSLCDIANKIINDQDAAQDIVQDVFLKLWKKEEEQLFAITNMKGYLFKATTNEAINYLERNKKKISLYKIKFTPAVNPVENFTANELEENIKSSLDRLPPKCKAIFVLSRFEGMKYREIAEHLEISVKTVETQMGIALRKMREDLKPYLTKEFIALAVSAGIVYLIHFLSVYFVLILSHS